MLVVTTNDMPGWEIHGCAARCSASRSARETRSRRSGAGLKSMFGGELKGMTKTLSDSRNEVMGRMIEEAERGAATR